MEKPKKPYNPWNASFWRNVLKIRVLSTGVVFLSSKWKVKRWITFPPHDKFAPLQEYKEIDDREKFEDRQEYLQRMIDELKDPAWIESEIANIQRMKDSEREHREKEMKKNEVQT